MFSGTNVLRMYTLQHEAGHFLIAYLVGILPKGYTLSSLEALMKEGSLNVQAGTSFVDFEFLDEVCLFSFLVSVCLSVRNLACTTALMLLAFFFSTHPMLKGNYFSKILLNSFFEMFPACLKFQNHCYHDP